MFVAAVLTAGGLFRSAMALRLEPALIQRTGNRLDVIAAYEIGRVAAFWLIERTSAFFCEVRKGCSGGLRSKAEDFRFWHFRKCHLPDLSPECAAKQTSLDHLELMGSRPNYTGGLTTASSRPSFRSRRKI